MTKNELIEQIHESYVDITAIVLRTHAKEYREFLSELQIAEAQYHLMAAKMSALLAIDVMKGRKNGKA